MADGMDDCLSDSSSDDSLKYFRPIYKKRGTGEPMVDPPKSKASASPVAYNSNCLPRKKVTKRLDFKHLNKYDFHTAIQPIVQEEQPVKPSKSFKLREFGEVGGYRFLVTEEEYDALLSQNQVKDERCNDHMRVNTMLYNKSVYNKNNTSGAPEVFTNFWKDNGEVRIPIPSMPLLSKVHISDICAKSVEDFLLKSSKQLNVPMKVLIRDQRIRWHPDRMTRRYSPSLTEIAVITLMSQILNELWAQIITEK